MELKQKHIPMRMCAGCRNMSDKSQLLRIVKHDDKLVIDIDKKIQSRGTYLCKNKDCLLKAQKRKTFSNILKNKVPDEFYEELAKHIEQ